MVVYFLGGYHAGSRSHLSLEMFILRLGSATKHPDLPMALASGQWMVIVRDNQAGLDMNMARQVFNQLSDLNFGMCLFFVVSVWCWMFFVVFLKFISSIQMFPILFLWCFFQFDEPFWSEFIDEDCRCSGILPFSWTRPLCPLKIAKGTISSSTVISIISNSTKTVWVFLFEHWERMNFVVIWVLHCSLSHSVDVYFVFVFLS